MTRGDHSRTRPKRTVLLLHGLKGAGQWQQAVAHVFNRTQQIRCAPIRYRDYHLFLLGFTKTVIWPWFFLHLREMWQGWETRAGPFHYPTPPPPHGWWWLLLGGGFLAWWAASGTAIWDFAAPQPLGWRAAFGALALLALCEPHLRWKRT